MCASTTRVMQLQLGDNYPNIGGTTGEGGAAATGEGLAAATGEAFLARGPCWRPAQYSKNVGAGAMLFPQLMLFVRVSPLFAACALLGGSTGGLHGMQ